MEPPPETRVAADGIKPFKRPWYRIKWNYYRSMWTYGLVCSLLGAIILAAIEDYPFIDCLFLSVSAYTGSGLVTIASDELSSETFVILFCIMLAGTTVTLLLLPMIWRIQVFNSLEPQTALVLKSVEHLIETPRVRNMLSLLSSRRAQVRGLRVVAWIVVLYLFLCLVGGWLVLWLILHFTEPVPELLNRGFSNQWVAAFTTVSAFSGTGITMTSDSLAQYWKAPAVYLFLCTTMLAGHDVVPVLLRGLLQLAQKYGRVFGLDRDGTWYALDHPRQMTTHLFDTRQTRILVLMLLIMNSIFYFAFMMATLLDGERPNNATPLQIAGAGLFQAITTRNAGFQIFLWTDLSQGILVVTIVMMYLSIAPFVSRMYVSEQTFDDSEDIGALRPTAATAAAAQSKFQTLFLFRHLSWLILVFSVISFVEDKGKKHSDNRIPLFASMFEIASAYGCVGLSLGQPDGGLASLSGSYTTLSKLLIISVMLLGKHRGLPAVSDMTLNFQYTRLRKALQMAQRESQRRASQRWNNSTHGNSRRSFQGSRRSLQREATFELDEAGLSQVRKELGLEDSTSGTSWDLPQLVPLRMRRQKLQIKQHFNGLSSKSSAMEQAAAEAMAEQAAAQSDEPASAPAQARLDYESFSTVKDFQLDDLRDSLRDRANGQLVDAQNQQLGQLSSCSPALSCRSPTHSLRPSARNSASSPCRSPQRTPQREPSDAPGEVRLALGSGWSLADDTHPDMTRHSSSGLPAGGSGPGRAGSSGSGRGTGGSGRGTGGPSLNCDGALSRLGRLPSSGVERAVAAVNSPSTPKQINLESLQEVVAAHHEGVLTRITAPSVPPSPQKARRRLSMTSTAESLKEAWNALWTPHAPKHEGQELVKPWELLRTDPLFLDVFESDPSPPPPLDLQPPLDPTLPAPEHIALLPSDELNAVSASMRPPVSEGRVASGGGGTLGVPRTDEGHAPEGHVEPGPRARTRRSMSMEPQRSHAQPGAEVEVSMAPYRRSVAGISSLDEVGRTLSMTWNEAQAREQLRAQEAAPGTSSHHHPSDTALSEAAALGQDRSARAREREREREKEQEREAEQGEGGGAGGAPQSRSESAREEREVLLHASESTHSFEALDTVSSLHGPQPSLPPREYGADLANDQ